MAMSVQEAYNILNKLHGYTGPQTKTAISNFINARDIPIAVKNRGGMVGYQPGGAVQGKTMEFGYDPEQNKKVKIKKPKPVETMEITPPDYGMETKKGKIQKPAPKKPNIDFISMKTGKPFSSTDNKEKREGTPPITYGIPEVSPQGSQPMAEKQVVNFGSTNTATANTGAGATNTEADTPYYAEDIAEGTRQLVGDAIIDPSKVVEKADVANIDADAEGTSIAEGTGQVGPDAPTADVATVDRLAQAQTPTDTDVATVDTFTSAEKMKELTEGVEAKTKDDLTKEVVGQTKTDTAISDLDAATIDEARKVEDAPTRVVETGETQESIQLKSSKARIEDMLKEENLERTFQQQKQMYEDFLKRGRFIGDPPPPPTKEQIKAQLENSLSMINQRLETMPKGPSELIEGTGVDQEKVAEAFGTGEVKAASVKDELSTLMEDFEKGDTPAWAAGSMRKAQQILAARGLGASSMAGQAVIQAAMEAALPIAQIDASNKQEMALFKAEQRANFLQLEFNQAFETKVRNAAKVSEIANMNFNADQQIALENAKMAQTVDLANLDNKQALIMAEAAQLSQLELESLSNQQQAQVENARNFLQLDLTNLANEQQTELFKAQQNANALLSDTASKNASEQFNASSINQMAQFDKNLSSQVSQFNAAQFNAMSQFNVNEENALSKFNAEIQNQRDMFNANNSLIIAQANAKWRQDTNTINTATQNQANFEFAKQVNGLSNKALDQIWQRERDLMQFAVAQSESALERVTRLLLADKKLDSVRKQIDATEGAAKTSFFARLLFGSSGLNLFGDEGLLGFL